MGIQELYTQSKVVVREDDAVLVRIAVIQEVLQNIISDDGIIIPQYEGRYQGCWDVLSPTKAVVAYQDDLYIFIKVCNFT